MKNTLSAPSFFMTAAACRSCRSCRSCCTRKNPSCGVPTRVSHTARVHLQLYIMVSDSCSQLTVLFTHCRHEGTHPMRVSKLLRLWPLRLSRPGQSQLACATIFRVAVSASTARARSPSFCASDSRLAIAVCRPPLALAADADEPGLRVAPAEAEAAGDPGLAAGSRSLAANALRDCCCFRMNALEPPPFSPAGPKSFARHCSCSLVTFSTGASPEIQSCMCIKRCNDVGLRERHASVLQVQGQKISRRKRFTAVACKRLTFCIGCLAYERALTSGAPGPVMATSTHLQ